MIFLMKATRLCTIIMNMNKKPWHTLDSVVITIISSIHTAMWGGSSKIHTIQTFINVIFDKMFNYFRKKCSIFFLIYKIDPQKVNKYFFPTQTYIPFLPQGHVHLMLWIYPLNDIKIWTLNILCKHYFWWQKVDFSAKHAWLKNEHFCQQNNVWTKNLKLVFSKA